jgi:uncharacterized membrane protein YeaQ/YmgE (transglycosylase-associated protein family)
MDILLSLLVGLIAGWLAGVFVRGRSYGIAGDTVIGLVGGLIGGILFRAADIETGNLLGTILVSFLGAAFLLILVRVVKRTD